MSLDLQRSSIKAKLEAVSGIGSVLGHIVWTDDWQFIFDNFLDANKERVHTWFIGLASSPSPAAMQNGIRTRSYVWNIVGYYSQMTSAKSSNAFENVIDSILAALDIKPSVGVGLTHSMPNLVGVQNVVFSQHICHTAQIQLTITEKTAVAGPCA